MLLKTLIIEICTPIEQISSFELREVLRLRVRVVLEPLIVVPDDTKPGLGVGTAKPARIRVQAVYIHCAANVLIVRGPAHGAHALFVARRWYHNTSIPGRILDLLHVNDEGVGRHMRGLLQLVLDLIQDDIAAFRDLVLRQDRAYLGDPRQPCLMISFIRCPNIAEATIRSPKCEATAIRLCIAIRSRSRNDIEADFFGNVEQLLDVFARTREVENTSPSRMV